MKVGIKMKIRPVLVLLLMILLLAGVAAGLYYSGLLDSFTERMEPHSEQQAGQGPVARREVSDLVLPLKSSETSEDEEQDESVEELNESEIPAAAVAANETGLPEKQPQTVDSSADSRIETPTGEEKVPPVAREKGSRVVDTGKGGIVEKLKIECGTPLGVKVPLSGPAGKIHWFSLKGPERLVVDMKGRWHNRGRSVYKMENCVVTKIVVGEHPDKVRFVFHLGSKKIRGNFSPEIKRIAGGLELQLDFQ